jgi:hypothetical protein
MNRLAFTIGLVLLVLVGCRRDTQRPSVLSSYPVAGATGVGTNARLRVTFSEEMDQGATAAAFHLTPAKAGSFTWDRANLYYQPNPALAPRTSYTMSVDTTALDLAGNRPDQPFSAAFTTGDSNISLTALAMLGRSVMNGWFSHWESDPGQPYYRDRFVLQYHEIQGPPDIVTSVAAIVDSLTMSENPVVFFKFCFVDFEGGDSQAAQTNLDRNLGYIQQVYDTASHRGLRLILGNALPQVSRYTDSWLVWNHRQYNQRLGDFAAQHQNVKVFDLYSVLSDANGALKAAYATSSDDSHPNDAGYTALDVPFFAFLEQNY